MKNGLRKSPDCGSLPVMEKFYIRPEGVQARLYRVTAGKSFTDYWSRISREWCRSEFSASRTILAIKAGLFEEATPEDIRKEMSCG